MMKKCKERYDLKLIIIPLIIIPGIIALSYTLGWAEDGISGTILSFYSNYQESGVIKQTAYALIGGIAVIGVLLVVLLGWEYLRLTWRVFVGGFNWLYDQFLKQDVRNKTGMPKLDVSAANIAQVKKMIAKYKSYSAHYNQGLLFITPPKQSESEQAASLTQEDASLNNTGVINKENIPVDSEFLDKVNKDLQQLQAIYVIKQDGKKISVEELVSGIFLIRAI
ncbi:MAG: hypothetical protein KJ915_08935 [Candidatus Omnitrophica bacterium]|nr:hypothetical protein [Candidatus Omnitrophota bacterium]